RDDLYPGSHPEALAGPSLMPMQLRWEIARPLPASDALAQALGLDPIVAQVLTARGYASAGPARQFLEAPLDPLENPDAIVYVADHHEPGPVLPPAAAGGRPQAP